MTALGDWWAYGQAEYGEGAEASHKLELNFQTVMNYGWVSRSVATSLRNEVLSFNHHYVAASMEPKQQKHWLKLAVENKWSVNQLKSAIRQKEARDKTNEIEWAARAMGNYAVLYADPPWRHEDPLVGGSSRSIKNQYLSTPGYEAPRPISRDASFANLQHLEVHARP